MKQLFILLTASIFFNVSLAAAGTVYYYGSNYEPVDNISDALFMKRVVQKGNKKYVVKTYSRIELGWEQE